MGSEEALRPKAPRRWAGGSALFPAGLVLGILLAITAACGAGTPEEWEKVYLRGRGPYRGRVVDAVTKQPIAEAVVLAVWYYDQPMVVDNVTRFHDALEVLADGQGNFVINAPEIERRAPPRTRYPVFTVFKPGYLYYRGQFAGFDAMADRANRPPLGIVELVPTRPLSREERLRALDADPGLEVPRAKIPNLIRAINEERRALGFRD